MTRETGAPRSLRYLVPAGTTRAGRLGAIAALTVTLGLAPQLSEPAVAGVAALRPVGQSVPSCVTPAANDTFEPPCNPHLASTTWGMTHRNPYAQASSPFPGPKAGAKVTYKTSGPLLGIPIITAYTKPYADGGTNLWMATASQPDGRFVYKADAKTGNIISSYGFFNNFELPGIAGVSGTYTLMDSDNHFVVARDRSISVYGDSIPGNRMSPIKRLIKFTIPDSQLCGPKDNLVGLNMLWDGTLTFVSNFGVVGTVPRQVDKMTAGNLVTTSINGPSCGAAASADSLETVTNSTAVDETGGIHVVTSAAMYRFNWNGTGIKQAWRTPYNSGSTSSVRYGKGSGSTPTLMGVRASQDKFVVITDGQKLMHLNLYWRDKIPADWKGIPGEDRRLACSVPVTFGDPAATTSQSEQSVLVRGYSSVVVNNQLKSDLLPSLLPTSFRLLAAALTSQLPNIAPHGMERIDWDPRTRTCRTTWANREISIPNGVPSMSTATGLIYAIGQRQGVWGLEGLDFKTGKSVLRVDTGLSPLLNAAYSATTIGPDGSIWTGGILGFTIFR